MTLIKFTYLMKFFQIFLKKRLDSDTYILKYVSFTLKKNRELQWWLSFVVLKLVFSAYYV